MAIMTMIMIMMMINLIEASCQHQRTVAIHLVSKVQVTFLLNQKLQNIFENWCHKIFQSYIEDLFVLLHDG